MDHLRSEEEQVAALKKWWSENGNSLLIGVGLALAAIFGWKAWQQHTKDQKEQASMLFYELNQAAVVQAAPTAEGEESVDNVSFLANDLQEKFPNSEYANFALLFEAKRLAEKGEFSAAEASLKEISLAKDDAALASVVDLRLAKLLAAQQKYDAAVALLDTTPDDSFYIQYQEVKGDILKMKGDRAQAKEAYRKALAKAEEAETPTQLLQIKIDDLADA